MATPTTLPATFTAGQVLTAAQMNNLRGAFRVLQVASVTKANTFSTSSTSFVDVTDLSVSITPSATSSKVLVIFNISMAGSTTNDIFANLVRGSTAIAQSSGATNNATFAGFTSSTAALNSWCSSYLDSPATTSATTYKFQLRAGSDTAYVNRRGADTSNGSVSTITVMEISA